MKIQAFRSVEIYFSDSWTTDSSPASHSPSTDSWKSPAFRWNPIIFKIRQIEKFYGNIILHFYKYLHFLVGGLTSRLHSQANKGKERHQHNFESFLWIKILWIFSHSKYISSKFVSPWMMRALNGCNHVQNSYGGCFHMIEDNTEWNLLTQTFLLFYNGLTECITLLNNNTNFKFIIKFFHLIMQYAGPGKNNNMYMTRSWMSLIESDQISVRKCPQNSLKLFIG